jgi:hypothetical protein
MQVTIPVQAQEILPRQVVWQEMQPQRAPAAQDFRAAAPAAQVVQVVLAAQHPAPLSAVS